MKTRNLILSLAAISLLAGCAKEVRDNQPEFVSGGKTFLKVGIETKTHMDASDGSGLRKVYWSNGDQIAVNGTSSDALTDIDEGTASTTFSFEGLLSTPYNIIYPASIYTDATHVTLPAVQDYKADGFAEGMNPMAGYSADGSSISLSHLCAILKISILRSSATPSTSQTPPDTDNIVAVRFKGRNNEQVSGSFSIDYENATISGSSSADGDKEVKVVKSQATSTSAAAVYYLVVPAGTYSNGFDVIVQDVNGHIMTKSKTTSKTLEAGHLYAMGEFEFVPTGTELGIEISSAQDLIDFANAYNNNAYAELGYGLVATITDDITFTTEESADFNATGGIGTNDNGSGGTNYFNGLFNGDNHTISGLSATVPVFSFTGGGGLVKDLNLSSTCSYTVNTSTGNNHGALVGRNKGTVQNCTSAASVTINNIQDVNTANQNYGGLVGYNPGGIVDGCTVSGDITCSQAGQTITANNAYIGGIAGYQQDEGTIEDCTFTGNITISDATTYGGITTEGKNFYVAGILGRAEKCVISGCTAGIDGTPRAIDVRGVLVPSIGGIIGWCANAVNSEISDCRNYMSLSFASNGARAKTTPCRIGGIAARSAADIKDCNNFGAITSVSNSTTVYLGGIVADGANVSNCINNATGSVTRKNAEADPGATNRYMYIGGIIGAPNAAADIKTCTNKASVTSNILGISTASTLDLGGIVGGGADKQIDIDGCTNEGEVKLDNNNESAVAVARIAIGGILGYATTANSTVTNSENKGKVWCNNNTAGSYGFISIGGTIGRTAAVTRIADCINSGEILCQNPGAATSAYVDLGGIVGYAESTITISGTSADATLNSGTVTVAQASSAVVYARNTQGGILGYGKGNDTKITNCKNTNQIYCNLTGVTANNRPSYTGGIVGILANLAYTDHAASKLSALTGVVIGNCVNTGKVNSSNYNNRAGNKAAPFAGGIAGLVSGTSSSLVSIHDCTVGNQQVYMYRGASGGGIIGYANYCNIEDCTSSADMSGMNASVNGVGGIAGRMFDSQMSGCTFSGKIAKAKNIGGLVYTLSEQQTGSTITGCKVNGVTLTTGTASDKTAAAVLISITDDKTNDITDCGVKGTLDGAAITLSSNMITTDGGATVSGTYLLP